MASVLRTARLELTPMTLQMVEAVILGDRARAEALAFARMPERWPNRELIERAFTVSLDAIRADPVERLWGARVMIAHDRSDPADPRPERRVIGSVVFRRDLEAADRVWEVAYGVEESSQGRGFATEAVGACVAWALDHREIAAVRATTLRWHLASVRVLEKIGMTPAGTRDHEVLGELLLFEKRADRA